MKVVETYSHLNGLEYLMVHKPGLWQEIQDVIAALTRTDRARKYWSDLKT